MTHKDPISQKMTVSFGGRQWCSSGDESNTNTNSVGKKKNINGY